MARIHLFDSVRECLIRFNLTNINVNDFLIMASLLLNGIKMTDKIATGQINKEIFSIVRKYVKSINRFCK